MTTATSSPLSDVSRKVLQVQVITLIWMSVEAIVSLGTAWISHCPALLAFGGDSLIEQLRKSFSPSKLERFLADSSAGQGQDPKLAGLRMYSE